MTHHFGTMMTKFGEKDIAANIHYGLDEKGEVKNQFLCVGWVSKLKEKHGNWEV